MLKDIKVSNIYIVCGHTDMRKSINIKDKDIKQSFLSMGILLDVRNDEPLNCIIKENRIKINNKEVRVLKLKYEMEALL